MLTRWREFQRSQREALRESNLLHPDGSDDPDGQAAGPGATRVLSGPDLLRDLLPDGAATTGVPAEARSTGPIPTDADRHERDAELAAAGELPYGRAGRPLNRQSPFYLGFVGANGVLAAILLWETVGISRPWAVAVVFFGLVGVFTLLGLVVVPPVVTQGPP